jgi:hypothetical protein
LLGAHRILPASAARSAKTKAADPVQYEIRARPRPRRSFSTLRPARVAIRRRKPWVRWALRLFG